MGKSVEIFDSWWKQTKKRKQMPDKEYRKILGRDSVRVAVMVDWYSDYKGRFGLKRIFSVDLGDFDGEPSLLLDVIGVHQYERQDQENRLQRIRKKQQGTKKPTSSPSFNGGF